MQELNIALEQAIADQRRVLAEQIATLEKAEAEAIANRQPEGINLTPEPAPIP